MSGFETSGALDRRRHLAWAPREPGSSVFECARAYVPSVYVFRAGKARISDEGARADGHEGKDDCWQGRAEV